MDAFAMFMATRDPVKVLAEGGARPVPVFTLPQFGPRPIQVVTEPAKAVKAAKPVVRFVGDPELSKAVLKYRAQLSDLKARNESQARMIAGLRKKLEGKVS